MPRLLGPLARTVTYTRWLHLLTGSLIALACALVYPGLVAPSAADWLLIAVLPVPLVVSAAMVPAMRLSEGLQARLMLLPGPHARDGEKAGRSAGERIAAAPSKSWSDRRRTAAWMLLRLELGCLTTAASVALCGQALSLVEVAVGKPPDADAPLPVPGLPRAVCALLVPVPLLVLLGVIVAAGALLTAVAARLLGPSAGERLAALEERTESLLERNRIARDLHDSIGHALTVAVVQAGAARTAGNADFTRRALGVIEETGRGALEDLERVLTVLREADRPRGGPTLAEADRLLDSARASGATVHARTTGALERLPGALSREGYRVLQEALTNVLRHAGPVPVRVRIAAAERSLELEVRNALAPGAATDGGAGSSGAGSGAGGGSGLRGIRERAVLLGGRASAGERDGEWRVRVELPLD